MIKILIIDDETPARKELNYLLSRIVKSANIYEADCGEQALEITKTEHVDAAFVDINLHDIDGLSLAKEIYEINKDIKIVFATAYDAYAVKAFELNAVDYILKPFEEDRIKLSVDKLLKGDSLHVKTEIDSTRAYINAAERKIRKISVWKGDRVVLIDIKDIVYIVTDERNCLIKTVTGEFSSNQNLQYFEKKLENENFFRVHRSYIINLESVKEILPWFNNTYIIKMLNYDKDEVPVSRNQVKKLKELFGF